MAFAARRPLAPEQRPNGAAAASRYLPYLPIIFQDNDFLSRFLQIFEAIWEPLEQRQDHIGMYLSRTCPASWLPWFASWFGLTLDPHLPEGGARALLAEAIDDLSLARHQVRSERASSRCLPGSVRTSPNTLPSRTCFV